MNEEYTEVELRKEAMQLAVQSGVGHEDLMAKAQEIYVFLTTRPGEPKPE